MRKKLLLLPFLITPLFLTSCTIRNVRDVNDVVVVEGDEIEVMRIKNSITDVYNEVSKSCVGVYCESKTQAGSGSGVIYKEENNYYYVVTNHHVVEDMSVFKVYDGISRYYDAELIGSDKTNDIAVIRFTTDIFGAKREFKSLDLFNEENKEDIPTVGQTVLAVGCPIDINNYNNLTCGVVCRYNNEQVTTDCALNPGNSGGGLFNMEGRLVGIVNSGLVWTHSDNEQIPVNGEGYAIHIRVVRQCILDIERFKKTIERPVLGIRVLTVNTTIKSQDYEQVKEYLPTGDEKEAYTIVESITPNSLASRSDLLAKDVILQINDKDIIKNSDIGEILHLANTGDTIKVLVYRKSIGQTKIIEIKV